MKYAIFFGWAWVAFGGKEVAFEKALLKENFKTCFRYVCQVNPGEYYFEIGKEKHNLFYSFLSKLELLKLSNSENAPETKQNLIALLHYLIERNPHVDLNRPIGDALEHASRTFAKAFWALAEFSKKERKVYKDLFDLFVEKGARLEDIQEAVLLRLDTREKENISEWIESGIDAQKESVSRQLEQNYKETKKRLKRAQSAKEVKDIYHQVSVLKLSE